MASIGFTGDFCPWGRMQDVFLSGEWQSTLRGIRDVLLKNDLNVFDLECPLTRSDKAIVKTGPHIKAIPETAEMISWLNCRLVATANNHFMDYGADGIAETYGALGKFGIDWVGSGVDLDSASAVKVLDNIGGLSFAIINMAENEWTTTSGLAPGCNPLNPIRAHRAITAYRDRVDFIVVVLHGGHEHYNLPSPRMKELYRFMIDAGADAVVGHHTHIVSGYEIYKERPIFYSLGNFCFDWRGQRDSTWNIGMILNLHFEKGRAPSFDFCFVRQNDRVPGVALIKGDEETRLRTHIESLCATIKDDSKLETAFSMFCNRLSKTMEARLEPYSNRYLVALNRRGLLPDLISKRKKILWTNLVRCESHREVLLEVLKKSID